MAVKMNVTGKNIKVTNAIKEYLEEKITKLEHFNDHILSANVILSVEKLRHIVEVTLQTAGSTLHVSEETDDLYKSIDACMDIMARKLKKIKDKSVDRKRNGESLGEIAESALLEGVEISSGHHVVQVDRYVKKPMTVDEAALELDLLDNDFLVFFNESRQRVNVIYRRKDGNFGLIDPKF
ncbi:ribosome-associated translation inhibitor RaiA [Candidatus Mcinerneyibacteriota bacterium]|nr:ribosome-associated translation inhibitor RaiA [Candidatus Mcinerneyibacteriota bacterium]